MVCNVINISIKDKNFNYISRQKKLSFFTDSTDEIYKNACLILDKNWDKTPIRQLGVSVSGLEEVKFLQLSIFEDIDTQKKQKIR